MARTKGIARVQKAPKPSPGSSTGVNKSASIQKRVSPKAAAGKKKSATKQTTQDTSKEVFGEYFLKIAKKLRDDDDREDYSLSVFPDRDGKIVWAKFELDCVEGCMKFGPRRISKEQITYDFKWRGRETGEGEIQCGSENKGCLKFSGDRVEGTVGTPYGKLEVTGKKVSERPRDTDSSTWEYCTEEEHEVEAVNRWK